MKTFTVYLAGKVPKGAEIGTNENWRLEYARHLSQADIFEFLSPEAPHLDESQPLLVFGHDCLLVQQCDLVIVNASTKLGVGTSQEMVIAKYFGKHVFTVLPSDSHHRRSHLQMYDYLIEDWIHPFLFAFSDKIFDSIEQLTEFVQQRKDTLLSQPAIRLDQIDKSIDRYRKHVASVNKT